MAENNGLALVNEDYTTPRVKKSLRVPEAIYEKFESAVPLGMSVNSLSVNLMIFYLDPANRKAVNDYIHSLSANAGQLGGS
jgi:hypothetical protein